MPSCCKVLHQQVQAEVGSEQETSEAAEEPLEALLDGKVNSVEFSGGHVIVDAPRRGRIYLPGSFNPLHEGHRSACLSQATMHFYHL